MARTLSLLGTRPDAVTAQVKVKTGRFRSRLVEREVVYQEWVIDGRPLRELVAWPNGGVAGEVTPIQNDLATPALATATLRTLLGEGSEPEWDTTMPDGRVALLVCALCFDLGCRTLTADLVMGDDLVEWLEVGWQVDYEPLDLSEQENPVISVRFERAQYEDLLHGLLEIEAMRQNSRSVGSSSPRRAL